MGLCMKITGLGLWFPACAGMTENYYCKTMTNDFTYPLFGLENNE